MKILVTAPIGYAKDTFFTERAKAELEKLGKVIYNPFDRQFTPEELCDYLEDMDILITSWKTPRLDSEVLKKADKLKLIAHTGGTVATLVTEALYEKDVVVLSGNIVFAESVAEGCLAYTMCALRRMEKYMGFMRDGAWRETAGHSYNEGIMDRTVGLVGFGMIAKFFAKMLAPFHIELKIYSGHLTQAEADLYNAELTSLNEIFETCDIISIHSAKTPKTYHLVGREQIGRMKDGALLVNTARGAIVDEQALIDELRTGRIHAALDVFKEEPLPSNSEFRKLPNALLIPHMGGPTIDRREYVVLELVNDIRKFIDGETELAMAISSEYAKNMTR